VIPPLANPQYIAYVTTIRVKTGPRVIITAVNFRAAARRIAENCNRLPADIEYGLNPPVLGYLSAENGSWVQITL